jgi:hypothetical protein
MRALMFCLLTLLTACATTPAPSYVWYKDRATTTNENFLADRYACERDARMMPGPLGGVLAGQGN